MRIIIVVLIIMGGNIMNRRKWDKIRTSKCFIGTVLIGLMLCACGSNEDGKIVEESKSVSIVAEEQLESNIEETVQNTENPVEDTETGKKDGETDEKSETTEMIDWETFAAQEDNEDICVAISNEINSSQIILYGESSTTVFYQYKEGDRVAVPVRDNIKRICYFIAEKDGTQKSDVINVYWKEENEIKDLSYVEIEIGNEPQYYISIFDDNDIMNTFGLYE